MKDLKPYTLGITYEKTRTIINNEENDSQTVIDYLGYNAYDAMVVIKNKEGTSDFFEREYNLMGNDGKRLKLDDKNGKDIIDLVLNPHILKLLELQYVTIENDIAKWEFTHTFNGNSEKVIYLEETDYEIKEDIFKIVNGDEKKATQVDIVLEDINGCRLISYSQQYCTKEGDYYEYADVDKNISEDKNCNSVYIVEFGEYVGGDKYHYDDKSNIYSINGNGNLCSITSVQHISHKHLNPKNSYYIKLDTSSLGDFTVTLTITTPSKSESSGYTLTKCVYFMKDDYLILYYIDGSDDEKWVKIEGEDKKKNIKIKSVLWF